MSNCISSLGSLDGLIGLYFIEGMTYFYLILTNLTYFNARRVFGGSALQVLVHIRPPGMNGYIRYNQTPG